MGSPESKMKEMWGLSVCLSSSLRNESSLLSAPLGPRFVLLLIPSSSRAFSEQLTRKMPDGSGELEDVAGAGVMWEAGLGAAVVDRPRAGKEDGRLRPARVQTKRGGGRGRAGARVWGERVSHITTAYTGKGGRCQGHSHTWRETKQCEHWHTAALSPYPDVFTGDLWT